MLELLKEQLPNMSVSTLDDLVESHADFVKEVKRELLKRDDSKSAYDMISQLLQDEYGIHYTVANQIANTLVEVTSKVISSNDDDCDDDTGTLTTILRSAMQEELEELKERLVEEFKKASPNPAPTAEPAPTPAVTQPATSKPIGAKTLGALSQQAHDTLTGLINKAGEIYDSQTILNSMPWLAARAFALSQNMPFEKSFSESWAVPLVNMSDELKKLFDAINVEASKS